MSNAASAVLCGSGRLCASRRLLLTVGVLLLTAGCAVRQSTPLEEVPRSEDTVREIGELRVRNVPAVPESLQAQMHQYLQGRRAYIHGWLGDGLLVSTRFGETDQLHRVLQPLGARTQLTFADEPVTQAFTPGDPSGTGFVFARDVGGSEFYQLFWFDLESGKSRLLTDGHSRYSDVVFDRQGRRFAYSTTERNGRDWDIHVATPDGTRNEVLAAGGTGWVTEDWSPDGSRLLVSRYVSINESYLYELDLENGVLAPLLEELPGSAVRAARYAPDGAGVFFTSDLGAEFLRLHYLSLSSGAVEVLTGGVPWDVEGFELSMDGRYLAFAVNEGGFSRLTVWRLPQRTPVALPEVPEGIVDGLFFDPEGSRLALTLSRPDAPADAYVLDLDKRSLDRWTRSEVGALDGDTFVGPELIHYPTFDRVGDVQRRIPAFVYLPHGPGPFPVYVYIHGGPESQYRPRFSRALQYYVNELGMAVVVPNVRGSAGYGKSYLKLDNGYLREDAVRDIGALLDWIGGEPRLDADRVAVSGGSYGGYMVLAPLVHFPERIRAGVERVGISNFVTFLENTEDYRRALRRAEYGDERDPEMRSFLQAISPLNQADRIQDPLLIFQGANDPRVPASESEQIADALRSGGVPVWHVLALDEGHGFRRKENVDYAAAVTVLFLQRYLLDD